MLTRRSATASLVGLTFTPSLLFSKSPDTKSHSVIDWSASQIAKEIAQRNISSVEVVSTFLDRISTVNGKLNAVVQIRKEESLREAERCDQEIQKGQRRGKLHGVPFTIKDSFDTAGVISTAGTLGRKNFVPKTDATVVQRVKDAGGILLGKTNTPELTLSYDTVNLVYGRTHNPHNLDFSPGGSSGGAAAILSASGAPFDIGSDTAGSIRVPSHFCGILGLKPTFGTVPRTGHIVSYDGPLQALTHIGPMARFVTDLELLMPIIMGGDSSDPHIHPYWNPDRAVNLKALRLGYFHDNGFCSPTEETQSTLNNVIDVMSKSVHSIKESLPDVCGDAYKLFGRLFSADGFDWVGRNLVRCQTKQSSLGMLRTPPEAVPTTTFVRLLETWDQVKSRGMKIWEDFDAILCPVAGTSAIRNGTPAPTAAFSYSAAINILGWPALSIPAGQTREGLPIGVQIIAPPWRENILFALGHLIEHEMGGWTPISVV